MPFRIEQLNVLNLATVGNSITAGSFVKSGGTSSQFLKADGSVDSSAYITGITSGMVTTALGYTPVPNTRNITINGVTQDLSVDRSWTISVPVSSVSGSGAGISVSPTTGAVVVSNTGVTSNVAGTGISVSGATGAVTITNTGVTSIVAGTAISISGATGAVTINNTGVTSLNGGTGAITGIATTAQLAGYLPLSGGTITGTLGVISDFSVNNTRFTVNAATGNTVASGSFTANSIIKSGGTSSQFLKADGSIDSNSYITSASVGNGTLTLAVSGSGLSGSASFTANQSGSTTFTVTSNATTSATANTLVYRDAGGHITGNYGFFAYVNTSDNDETGITRFVIKNGDNYHRSATTTTAMTVIRGVASGTWGIDISGNSATTTNFRHLGANVSYDNDRTTKVSGGLAVYSGYSTGANRPTTYDISAQFSVNGNMGMEIAADWISTSGPTLFARSLRDCCQNWSSWITLLTSLNYNSYSPTLTGGGASGTWSINITGNADTVDNFHASQSTVANNIVVRDANGYIFGNYINMTDDGNPGGGTSISSFITKQGDNYYRSVSPTNAMVSIRGVASGSWGINITGTAGSETLATVTGRGASTSSAVTLNNTLTVGGGSVYTYMWNDGSGTYLEAVGNTTATRKIRIQGNNGSGSYAQLFIDGGNNQVYTTVGGVTNFLVDGSVTYLRHNGSDKFWTGSDGTRNAGWLYMQNGGNGIHYPGYNSHFYMAGGAYWHMNPTEGLTYGALILYSNYNGTSGGSAYRKGYLYYDTNGFGLLGGGDANWAINVNSSTSKYVTIGGDQSNNAYNAVTGVRLMFGGGNSDAQGNYYIGTNLNNYGGNYNKLDLAWHTGIRIGAQTGYGGIRMYNDEDFTTLIFSVGEGDSNVRVTNNLYMGGNIVATQSWVNSQGFATGGPFVQNILGDSGAYNLNTSGQQAFFRFSTGAWVNGPTTGNYSHVLSVNGASDNRTVQIYLGDVPGYLWWRPNQGGTWHGWERILTSYNYNGWAPTLTGGGASGTWGINITGSAGSASTASQVTINYNNDSNSTYQILWGSGNSVYGTAGVYVNPYDDRVYANYFSAYYYIDVYTSAGGDYLRINDNQVYRPGAGPLYLNWSSNGNVYATGPGGGNMGVGNNSPSYKLHVSGDIYANGGWLRVSGTSGLYFESYGGGWHMNDGTWIRSYNGKNVYMSADVRTGSQFQLENGYSYWQRYGTWSSSLHRIAYMSFDWDGSYNTYSNHGISSTDLNGSFTDSMSINSFNDINLRLDSNGNNSDSYVRFHNDTTGANTFAWVGFNGSNYAASFSRDIYMQGNTGGNFGNRLIVGGSSTPYTLQDSNIRPTIYMTGAYPVLTLNHTETSNTQHGPTIQFAFNGLSNRQWVIGCNGQGTFMDFGFSSSGYGNTDFNPHNGISGYAGNTIMRIIDNAVGIGGDWGNWGAGNPAYTLDVRGTIYSNTDMRAPIFYDSANTSYYCDPASTSVLNTISSYTIYNTSLGSGYYFTAGSWGWRHQTPSGYIEFGPANTSYAHIYTDRGNFYFNVYDLYLNGYIVPMYGYNRGGDLYASRYYDANDTGYYLDPNGTSELNSITTGTRARWGEPRWWHNRQAETSDQNYWTGTNGWGTSYGNWDNAWRGGFSGWDIWGTGTAHPQGSGYIHAQGIVSGQHYANSDGSAAYGWMMVGAGDATANRYWLRGKWGGSTSGWVEMITTGNIGSQNVNYASQAGTASFAASAGNTSSISSAVGNSYTWTGIQYFQSNLGGYCGSLSGPPLQAYSTGNNSAFMSFHKGGYYAVNMGLDADSVLRIGGWSAAANRWQLDMSGNMTVAGDVTAYSDARVKENIETVEDALDKVLNLRGVYYNRTDSDDKRRKVGVIAQEILEVIPEVVGQDNDGMYNVSYGNIVGVLIEAIKEQQKQIDELKARLD